MKFAFIAIALLASTALAAQDIINHRPDQVVESVEMNTVVFVDHRLNRTKDGNQNIRITVDNAGIANTPGGYREAWAVFRNHTDYDYTVEVKTHFFDMREVITDSTKWQRVHLPANSIGQYKESSIDLTSYHFRMEVRSTR